MVKKNKKSGKKAYRHPKLHKTEMKIYASQKNFDQNLLAEFVLE